MKKLIETLNLSKIPEDKREIAISSKKKKLSEKYKDLIIEIENDEAKFYEDNNDGHLCMFCNDLFTSYIADPKLPKSACVSCHTEYKNGTLNINENTLLEIENYIRERLNFEKKFNLLNGLYRNSNSEIIEYDFEKHRWFVSKD